MVAVSAAKKLKRVIPTGFGRTARAWALRLLPNPVAVVLPVRDMPARILLLVPATATGAPRLPVLVTKAPPARSLNLAVTDIRGIKRARVRVTLPVVNRVVRGIHRVVPCPARVAVRSTKIAIVTLLTLAAVNTVPALVTTVHGAVGVAAVAPDVTIIILTPVAVT